MGDVMFGNIIKFEQSKIYVENKSNIANTNYIGFHVVFDEPNHKTVGEIVDITKELIGIQLIGEIINNVFTNGVLRKPGFNNIARLIYKNELDLILGNQDLSNRSNLLVGTSPIYKDYYITCNLNEFFANHFAVIGNTGSGKSCGLTRLIQNVFFTANNKIPVNAHMCLFDVYGEYYNTFDSMNDYVGLHFKKYTTEINFGDASLLTIPAYLLTVDDLAILLGVKDASQLPVLAKSLELVRIFCSNDPKANEYKNDIIAKTVLDILSSGKNSTQIRDQVISILTSYNTEDINLNSKISQPGYERTLRQCLNIDDQGKINALSLVIDYLQKYIKVDIDIKLNEDITYTLSDLYYALEFALISEGILTSESAFDRNNILKSRLQSIINSNKNEFFKFDRYLSRSEFVEEFFKTGPNGENVQLVDINLSFIEDSFAKCLTKIFSRVFFEHTTSLNNRGSYPIHIILEEAHRYVQNDSDINVLGYNIFDRITKEGRKYGTILGFVTQRPNELSKTALSQCSNFVVFRLFYPEDLEIVKGISSNVTEETLEKIKTLKPGMSLVFGTAFKVPLLVKFPLPNPMPVSTSLKIDNVWYN